MYEDLEQIAKLKFGKEMRAPTILGLVGGGGLGQAIHNNVQLGFLPRLGTLNLLTYALVLTSDWIGERLR
jgi:ABC-type phosphate/phosphonate transport system permease subunit